MFSDKILHLSEACILFSVGKELVPEGMIPEIGSFFEEQINELILYF